VLILRDVRAALVAGSHEKMLGQAGAAETLLITRELCVDRASQCRFFDTLLTLGIRD
jgi:hypothetical protein